MPLTPEEQRLIDDETGTTGSRGTVVIHGDGSKWLHNPYTGEPISQLSAAPQPESTPQPSDFTFEGDRYTYKRGRDGQWYPYVSLKGEDAAGAVKTVTRGNTIYRQEADGRLTPIQELPATPTAAPQRAPRFPEEIVAAQLSNEKLRRSLEDPFTSAYSQMDATIQAIQGQLAAGQIDQSEANRLMALARSNVEAALLGTTISQQQERQRLREKQQQDLADSLLQRQVAYGTQTASSLLSGLLGAYGKVLKSSNAPAMPDPYAMAKSFVMDLSGGSDQQTALAAGIIRGALGGEQPASPQQSPASTAPARTYPQQFDDGQYEVSQWADGSYTKKYVNDLGAVTAR